MLRVLIGSGLFLMAAGFGAAGWQYWQGLQDAAAPALAEAAGAPGADVPQSWLMTATGGLVPRADVQAYLQQDRLVPGRAVTITRTAPLAALLAEGEKLPEPPYLEVLADIRAPKIAEPLCPVLLAGFAQTCVVQSARVVEGSVNAVLGTARFRIELVYRETPAEGDLPDVTSHVLDIRSLPLDLAADPAAEGSAEAALAAALQATGVICAAEGGIACRVLDLSLDWSPGLPPRAGARLAWLAPLPEGMFIAPTLDPTTPEG
jgi:hypothetical protein